MSKPIATTELQNSVAVSEWWNLARCQSPLGILVQVENGSALTTKPIVTEILFYGTIATRSNVTLPTPPSSSPQHLDADGERLPELRVHALPLSSHLLYNSTTELPSADEPQFLPSAYVPQPTPTSPKKGRDIFEEATIASKKARGRGGQGVAAAAARGTDSQLRYTHPRSFSYDARAPPTVDSRPSSANGTVPRPASRPLSRSSSVSFENRSLSRKESSNTETRRSNLSQVATIPTQPEEPTTESRNKDALSKVVMAAMRMHGLQQRKKARSRRASVALGIDDAPQLSDELAADDAAKDEEYKLIYHQTYKGAALALVSVMLVLVLFRLWLTSSFQRKHMAEKPLHAQPDRMRDVVEKLLTIFLTDPLAEPLPSDVSCNPVATPGSKSAVHIPGSSHHHASPFDLPSIRRPGMNRAVTDSHVFTGSPMSKKRHENADLAVS